MIAESTKEACDEIGDSNKEPTIQRKYTINEKTRRFMTSLSNISIPQFLRKSKNQKGIHDQYTAQRPNSLYYENLEENPINLSKYMEESTLLNALRDIEIKLLESESHRFNLELKVKSMEKEIEYLQNENQQQITKERSLMLQIQEFERRNQTKEAECQEMSLNARIREMELSSEIASLSQMISTIETQKQEKQIHKIMESQNRIMEQTLPYTMSTENIFDNEDGLFNTVMFDEVVKEQSKFLGKDKKHLRRSSDKSDESIHFQDPDDYGSSFD